MFYCEFYFTCDRSLKSASGAGAVPLSISSIHNAQHPYCCRRSQTRSEQSGVRRLTLKYGPRPVERRAEVSAPPRRTQHVHRRQRTTCQRVSPAPREISSAPFIVITTQNFYVGRVPPRSGAVFLLGVQATLPTPSVVNNVPRRTVRAECRRICSHICKYVTYTLLYRATKSSMARNRGSEMYSFRRVTGFIVATDKPFQSKRHQTKTSWLVQHYHEIIQDRRLEFLT